MDSLTYCQKNKGLVVCSFVLMSNHLHIIAYAKENSEGLSNVIRDFKRHTAKQILKAIENGSESRKEWLLMVFKYQAKYNKRNRDYQFWQQDNHPIELESPNWINQKIMYIHLCPDEQNKSN